jgi:hypothetical protein
MQMNKTTNDGEAQSVELDKNNAKGFMTISMEKGKAKHKVRAYFNATLVFGGDNGKKVTNASIDWLDLRYVVKGKWKDYPNGDGRVYVIENTIKKELIDQSIEWDKVA